MPARYPAAPSPRGRSSSGRGIRAQSFFRHSWLVVFVQLLGHEDIDAAVAQRGLGIPRYVAIGHDGVDAIDSAETMKAGRAELRRIHQDDDASAGIDHRRVLVRLL